MASSVTELTLRAYQANSYDVLSTTVGVLGIITLAVLLVAREALKATSRPELVARSGPITALSIPLMAPWVLVTAVRLIRLL